MATSQVLHVPSSFSFAAASLLFSVHSTASNLKDTSYNFLLDMVPATRSPPVAIVAPQLSSSTNVLIERPCTWILANLALF